MKKLLLFISLLFISVLAEAQSSVVFRRVANATVTASRNNYANTYVMNEATGEWFRLTGTWTSGTAFSAAPKSMISRLPALTQSGAMLTSSLDFTVPTSAIFFDNSVHLRSNSRVGEFVDLSRNHNHEVITTSYDNTGSNVPVYYEKSAIASFLVQTQEDATSSSFSFIAPVLEVANRDGVKFLQVVIEASTAGNGAFTMRYMNSTGRILVTETDFTILSSDVNNDKTITLENPVDLFDTEIVHITYSGTATIKGHIFTNDPNFGSGFVPKITTMSLPFVAKNMALDEDVPDNASQLPFVKEGEPNTNVRTELLARESSLGNPSSNGQVLSSTTAGARSWISLPDATGSFRSVFNVRNVNASTLNIGDLVTYDDFSAVSNHVDAASASGQLAGDRILAGIMIKQVNSFTDSDDALLTRGYGTFTLSSLTGLSLHSKLYAARSGSGSSFAWNLSTTKTANSFEVGIITEATNPTIGLYNIYFNFEDVTAQILAETKEPRLGNPTATQRFLTSTTTGTRSWQEIVSKLFLREPTTYSGQINLSTDINSVTGFDRFYVFNGTSSTIGAREINLPTSGKAQEQVGRFYLMSNRGSVTQVITAGTGNTIRGGLSTVNVPSMTNVIITLSDYNATGDETWDVISLGNVASGSGGAGGASGASSMDQHIDLQLVNKTGSAINAGDAAELKALNGSYAGIKANTGQQLGGFFTEDAENNTNVNVRIIGPVSNVRIWGKNNDDSQEHYETISQNTLVYYDDDNDRLTTKSSYIVGSTTIQRHSLGGILTSTQTLSSTVARTLGTNYQNSSGAEAGISINKVNAFTGQGTSTYTMPTNVFSQVSIGDEIIIEITPNSGQTGIVNVIPASGVYLRDKSDNSYTSGSPLAMSSANGKQVRKFKLEAAAEGESYPTWRAMDNAENITNHSFAFNVIEYNKTMLAAQVTNNSAGISQNKSALAGVQNSNVIPNVVDATQSGNENGYTITQSVVQNNETVFFAANSPSANNQRVWTVNMDHTQWSNLGVNKGYIFRVWNPSSFTVQVKPSTGTFEGSGLNVITISGSNSAVFLIRRTSTTNVEIAHIG